MVRIVTSVVVLGSLICISPRTQAGEITGHYMEARTCQVYTGPCFAAGEVGLTGKDAVMAWDIQTGTHAGVDLAGLRVALIVRASRTIGFVGVEDAQSLGSMILVDDRANPEQRQALLEFAKANSGKAGDHVQDVRAVPIDMQLNLAELTGDLQAGQFVTLKTRKARPGDCICSNESAYYPPLTRLTGFVPSVTIEGEVRATALGSHWAIPDTRTAYLGLFAY